MKVKNYEVRFYRTNGSPLKVVIQAETEQKAREIVKAQYGATFRMFAESREIK